MLWLLSTSSSRSVSTLSRVMRSIVCATSSSETVKADAGRSETKRPFLSYTDVSSSTPVTSVFSTTSKGGSVTLSRSVSPFESAAWTMISRFANGLSSTHSTAHGGPFSTVPTLAPSTKKSTGDSSTPGASAICATIRTRMTSPVRPSGEVIFSVDRATEDDGPAPCWLPAASAAARIATKSRQEAVRRITAAGASYRFAAGAPSPRK